MCKCVDKYKYIDKCVDKYMMLYKIVRLPGILNFCQMTVKRFMTPTVCFGNYAIF